ncbi:MAG TPA: LCP family protein, partial [Acidimicrobiales bacterium]
MSDKRRRGPRRTWPQRLVLVGCLMVVVGCLVSAGVVWYGNNRLGALERVTILHGGTTVVDSAVPGAPTTVTAPDNRTPANLESRNFLLVGSDTRACLDEGSPFAPAVEAQELGERSDTIIVVRVEPQTNKAAMLSFPRDLWVKIAGTGHQSRINSAYDRENPSRLVQTIEQNFGISVDHYVEVTFCAFKRLVDAVGGVKVPFEFAARDKNTGLNVQPGCVEFNGDAALAYVRSRHYEWFDGKRWHTDNASDFGRIARQQDFIRRSLQRAL